MDYLFQMLVVYAADDVSGDKQTTKKSSEPRNKKPIVGSKFSDDIKNLRERFTMNPGTEIIITLQELLKICPRERKRSDAYRGLIEELKRQRITLTIKSRKNRTP